MFAMYIYTAHNRIFLPIYASAVWVECLVLSLSASLIFLAFARLFPPHIGLSLSFSYVQYPVFLVLWWFQSSSGSIQNIHVHYKQQNNCLLKCAYVFLIGASAASLTLVVKTENIYVWYVHIPYTYTSCPICARCNISTLHVGSCNHCCSRDKTSRTERLNSGNQRNRNLKTVRKGRHYYQHRGWLLMCCMTLPPTGSAGSVYYKDRAISLWGPEPERSTWLDQINLASNS